jgi:hypothetical protein
MVSRNRGVKRFAYWGRIRNYVLPRAAPGYRDACRLRNSSISKPSCAYNGSVKRLYFYATRSYVLRPSLKELI